MGRRGSKPYQGRRNSDEGERARRTVEPMKETVGIRHPGFYLVEGPQPTLLLPNPISLPSGKGQIKHHMGSIVEVCGIHPHLTDNEGDGTASQAHHPGEGELMHFTASRVVHRQIDFGCEKEQMWERDRGDFQL